MESEAANPSEHRESARRLGNEDSATRASLIDAARRLLVREGYAAVTSRRVAAEAGLKPQLIHYYFRAMEDLLLAVLQRSAGRTEAHLAALLDSDEPLRALWAFSGDASIVDITTEFTALAVHNEAIRDALADYAERFRAMQAKAIARHCALRGIVPRISPLVASVLMVSLANTLVREKALGMSLGHAETETLVEACLTRFHEGDGNEVIDAVLAKEGRGHG